MTFAITLPPWLPWVAFAVSVVVNLAVAPLLRRAWRTDREWRR